MLQKSRWRSLFDQNLILGVLPLLPLSNLPRKCFPGFSLWHIAAEKGDLSLAELAKSFKCKTVPWLGHDRCQTFFYKWRFSKPAALKQAFVGFPWDFIGFHWPLALDIFGFRLVLVGSGWFCWFRCLEALLDHSGWSALMLASAKHDHRLVRALLDAGADPSTRTRSKACKA